MPHPIGPGAGDPAVLVASSSSCAGRPAGHRARRARRYRAHGLGLARFESPRVRRSRLQASVKPRSGTPSPPGGSCPLRRGARGGLGFRGAGGGLPCGWCREEARHPRRLPIWADHGTDLRQVGRPASAPAKVPCHITTRDHRGLQDGDALGAVEIKAPGARAHRRSGRLGRDRAAGCEHLGHGSGAGGGGVSAGGRATAR